MDNTQVTAYQPQSTGLSVFSDANIMRSAELLANSDIIPQAFSGKPANVLIAMDMSQRLGASPMLVMQNLYVIQGKPSWSSQYLIAMVNGSGRFTTPLQFDFERDASGKATGCRAWAVSAVTGEKIVGPAVTMEMAKAEGWLTKSGSKWQTMPELMLTYRAAAFFARTVCPDIAMGMYTEYEQSDIQPETPIQYEDKTAPTPTPAPAEPEQPKQPSPKMRLWNAVLEQVEGDEAKAADICKAVVGGQTVTEDNIGGMIIEASKMITEAESKTEPEEVPDHLREEPF